MPLAPAPLTLLQTPRLRLRAFAHGDLDALGRIYADPRVMEHLGEPMDTLKAFRVAAGALRWCRDHSDPDRPGVWAIERREDGVLVGRVGLSAWTDADGVERWELGYLLGSSFWGCGYATEAAGALRDHARDHLGLRRLVALVHPDNAGSHAVLRKLGFTWAPPQVTLQQGRSRQVWRWSAG